MHHSADIEFVCTHYCHPAVCDLLILFQIAKLEKIFRLYYYANELPVVLTMSSVFVVELVNNDKY